MSKFILGFPKININEKNKRAKNENCIHYSNVLEEIDGFQTPESTNCPPIHVFRVPKAVKRRLF